jgi:hypothetical protein
MPPEYFVFNLCETVFVSVYFSTVRGRVIEFAVKLRVDFEGKRYEVIRYDAAHGGPHKDVLRPDGTRHE